ncbi:hypothetical protein BCR44DRAFT_1261527 [Catenaria anguillulae PL171]|uniref:Signal transduction histidine kinase dimerisation/phosphoacceptor domain-containing protein n=1 Tax=Catenaria anguillulae PL171 TaxID=765915 RepID=A0A1Y2HAT4_9FUNG|nr:hypothetical protein BCR44DRAFT_1261527 [Catenaria anguillulae PL171]
MRGHGRVARVLYGRTLCRIGSLLLVSRRPPLLLFQHLQRTCLSLGDSLALDIATNLVTYADDLAGYVATEPNLSNAAVTKFTSLATNHSEETDGISLVPVLPRHRKPEWEQQFNLTLIDGNDTFTRLSLVAPITLRVQFTPSRTPMKNPIGYNMFQAGEYARSVRRTLGNGRPSLVVAEPGSTQLHPPHKRVWIAKGVQQVPVPNFHIWIMTLLVDTQRAVSRTLAPSDRTHGIRVKLVDNTTTSELYVSQFPPNSTLIPSDTTLTSFPVVDRNWTLTCTGTHTLRGAFYTPWSWVLLFLLISVFTVSAEIARRAAVRFLAARGVARQVKHREGLVASLRMYSRAIVSTVRDPLIALDPFGYLVGSNKEALARLDIHGPDTSSVHISSLLPPEFVANVMNTPHQLPVASPAVPPMVDQDWDSVYTVTGGAASDPLPLLEPLPPGSYEVGPVGTQSAKFIAEATVSQPTAAKRGEVSQVLLLHDVTERIQALESLQAAREAAKAASVAKSQLLLLISHELRNPIYVISTLVEEIAAVAATADPLAPASGDSIGMRPARTDDSEYIAAARVQHTTRLIADILGFLVDLFADTTALEAARLAATVSGGPKTARAKGPGKHLISLANAALASVHPQLDLWDITVERWISPEWVLHGPTVTVERILAKVAYIVAHATRPYGQAVLELLVDLRNRELRVYCRGDMWIPTENSLQPMASIPPQSPLATSLAPSVQQEKLVMWHEDKIAVPEHIDPLTHAALFLAMGSVCAIVLPMNGSAFRTQFSEQYGGLDMSIPLGLMRAKRVKCAEASGEDTQAVVPVPAAATAPFSEELVSLASVSSLGMGTPARPSLPFDGPQRNLAPSSDAYPSPISPDRVTLPLPKMTVPQVVPIDSIAVHPKRYDENHRKELFTPCHSRTNSFSNPASFPQSPSSAPRTPRTAYSPCPPPNSRRESRMTSLMAVRTMTPHSPSPPASVGVAPPAPSSSASNESPSSDLSHASPLDFQPLIPSNDTLPLHIPLPSSPAPSAKSLKLSVPLRYLHALLHA